METLGERVKRLREAMGLRPEHLAAAANVSVATIYNLENNKHMIRADCIVPLAKRLNVTPAYLLGCEDEELQGEGEPAAIALVGASR
jgi:transcriptional regulator with XRE-family HTH domain